MYLKQACNWQFALCSTCWPIRSGGEYKYKDRINELLYYYMYTIMQLINNGDITELKGQNTTSKYSLGPSYLSTKLGSKGSLDYIPAFRNNCPSSSNCTNQFRPYSRFCSCLCKTKLVIFNCHFYNFSRVEHHGQGQWYHEQQLNYP